MPTEAKKILFVCIGNACRSQMAEGFARHYGGNLVMAYSAGSRPAGFVAEDAVTLMAELGIDIGGHYSKGLEEVPQAGYDAVVTMGCGDACPWIPATRQIDWKIPDPFGRDLEYFRAVRDQIEREVLDLLRKIFPSPTGRGSG